MSTDDRAPGERVAATSEWAVIPVPRALKRSPCGVFISYALVDEGDRKRLETHLAPLVREGLVEVWHDRVINPGAEWASDIERHLAGADIVILLVSADFVASIFCFEKELAFALRRHEENGLRILPVVIKPVDFANLPFARFQALPQNIKPVSMWKNVEEAWLDVALGVRKVVEDLHASHTSLPAQRGTPAADESSLGNQLEKYYGRNNCVVDGPATDDTLVDWVPLYENPSSMRFENLVPLSRRHRIRPVGVAGEPVGRTGFRFGFDLTTENLLHRSRQHFHQARPALAFGCSRLGDALTDRFPDVLETQEDDGWAFLSLCLVYLPYRMHGGLLDATLRRIQSRLTVNSNCPTGHQSTLLLSIANLYQDFGDWARAEQLYDHVLRNALTTITVAAARRRRAIGKFFTGSSDHSVDESFRQIAEYRTGVDFLVSLTISHGWWHLARDRPEECLHILEPFDFENVDESLPYSPHNRFELKLTQASALCALGLDYRAPVRLVQQLAQHASQMRLRPVFTEHVAPNVLAPQLGSIIKRLSSPMVVTPSLLAELDATTTALLAVPGGAAAHRPTWVD